MCDKVCQNSMMIFLFIYVYLSVCELGLCSVERRKYMRRSHFVHTKREALVCSGQYFISIIHVCILLGNIQIILLNHACTHFLVFY